jgi:hypothetical protein
MGLLTYVIAITIGSVILVVHMYGSMPPEFRAEGGGDVVGAVPMMSFVAMFVLFPLLPACVACGALWAGTLRRVIRASGGVGVELPSRPFDAAPFALAVLLLGAGWLLFAGLISGIGAID